MPKSIRRPIRIALLSAFAVTIGPATALAQSGSAGGSIGNDEKSVSGSRQAPRSVETEKPARRSKPAEKPRRAARERDGGGGVKAGGGNFDGAWVAHSTGNTCGSATERFVISGGRLSGELSSGQVSPNGSTRSGGSASGLTWNSSGRFSGRSGSGTFVRSDGCSGRWTASKQ